VCCSVGCCLAAEVSKNGVFRERPGIDMGTSKACLGERSGMQAPPEGGRLSPLFLPHMGQGCGERCQKGVLIVEICGRAPPVDECWS
jgi:hypothetical protein